MQGFLTFKVWDVRSICVIWLSLYRAVNTLHFGYKNQSANDV